MLCGSVFDVELLVPEAAAFWGVVSTRRCAPLPAYQVPMLACDNGYREFEMSGSNSGP